MGKMGERAANDPQPTATLAYGDGTRKAPPALAETMAAVHDTLAAPTASMAATGVALVSGVRSTVLPRLEGGGGGVRRVVVAGKQRYEAVRHLGAGGQAEVTLARDHDIDRAVALKRLLPDRVDEASVLRFAEEIRTVGQLEHPNIVPIHDVGVDEQGQYFFVMKYVEGETLESIIHKLRAGDEAYLRRYTPEYRLQICNEILRGVEHAHELGIVHRDLKPANVMVGSLGEAVIMDWGLAKRIDQPESAPAMAPRAAESERERLFETHAGALLGTPAYMAPEQASGRLDAVDARSDVYSLAVMFYEFLCLRHPRRRCTSVAEMIAAVVAEPISKAQLLSDFGHDGAPAPLAHFVRHGLASDPAQRYPSVAAMRQRLGEVRDGRAPVECHVTFALRALDATARTVNRHPYLLLAGLIAGVVGVAGVIGGAALLLLR
jgi:eukaryotic-like serine/threonine-protein kinase